MDAPPPQPPSPAITREAWDGCSVLLDINDGDRLAFFRLTPAATVKIGNKTFSLQPLVGRPFGSLFRVGADGLVPCTAADASSLRDDNTRDGADGQVQDETRDNRSLVDNNTAQNLSSDDIEAMKRDGATGDEIVEALIANSTTFGKKTAFSQEKYKLKKQKKYAPKVLLRRPTARRFMRFDTLSLLLSMANVGPYSDVLVVDMVGGLVAGAVAERLGGTGYVCSTYLGKAPSSIDIIRLYNLSGDMTSRIVQAPLSELQNFGNTPSVPNDSSQGGVTEPIVVSAEDTQLTLAGQGDTSVSDEKPKLSTEQPIDMEVSEPLLEEHVQDETSSLDSKGNDGSSITSKSVKHGKAPSPEKMTYWKEHGFSRFLNPGFVNTRQVLPSRSHPHMQMNAFGGYILSGTRIHNADAVIANK
ncbi:hypothetical protein PR202_gb27382 [Eleusine coracana subsp. coracana]|uniref:tRNA (adenine(58)-N(1))-methyltransferase non-catalytic subunit TRM6 n=1 Tax=Eleusine coracana subsp. coracana TaxID=191504 RepID=A0AAV5FRN0_ELECO|nr:hypothetical protein PR202_gb27382 [Eleusine coracana subsp. coracana]